MFVNVSKYSRNNCRLTYDIKKFSRMLKLIQVIFKKCVTAVLLGLNFI